MLLGQRLAIDRMGWGSSLDVAKGFIDNKTFKPSMGQKEGMVAYNKTMPYYVDRCWLRQAITATYKYQRRVDVEDCYELSKDVFPSLTVCTFLRALNLSGTCVEGLGFLYDFLHLAELKLARTHITDWSGLSRCVNLVYLDLSHTSFNDITTLAGCKKLKRLDLGGSQVSDVTPLQALGCLAFLYLDGCPVTNIDALVTCTSLQLVNIGFTNIDPATVHRHFDKSILDVRPRSTRWFEAVFSNDFDLLPEILNECQWINERVHPQLANTTGFRCYNKVCHKKTNFFSFEAEVNRATALHVAAFLGYEMMVKTLVDLRADANLTCWFGDVQGTQLARGKQGKELTVSQLVQVCGDTCVWGTTRDHYKRGLNTRKVCGEKAERIKRILQIDPQLTLDMIKEGEEGS